MKKTILIILGLSILNFAFGKPYKEYLNTDFVIVKNEIWFLQEDSTLKVFDSNTGKVIFKKIDNTVKLYKLTKDNKGSIVAISTNNRILRLNNKTLKWKTITTYKEAIIYDIFFDTTNDFFLITNKGIVNPLTKEKWFPEKHDNYIRNYDYYDWTNNITHDFIDHDNNIWISAGHGEYGGGIDLSIFNTIDRKFMTRDTTGDFIEAPFSCCQNGKDSYIAAGVFGGGIFKSNLIIKNNLKKIHIEIIYNTNNNPPDTSRPIDFIHGIYGPIAYNKNEHCMYMSNYKGLYKGDITKELSSITNWQKVPNFTLDSNDMRPTSYQGHYDSLGKLIEIPLNKGDSIPYCNHPDFSENGNLVFLNDNRLFLFDGKKIKKLADAKQRWP